jgi:hypothetical protein
MKNLFSNFLISGIHFSNMSFGITDHSPKNTGIYSYENSLYIRNMNNQLLQHVSVYDLIGNGVFSSALNSDPIQKFLLNVNPGYYLVKVVSNLEVITRKVYLN